MNVPAAERNAYLDDTCAGATAVRIAVDELLRAHYEASQTFLEPHSLVFRAAWLFQEGDRIGGRFRVVKPIARGAMGEVYRVYDERLRLDVALKAIRPELVGDKDTAERFRREVLVTRDIAHEGLCRVFDLVEHQVSAQAGLPAGTIVPCLTMQLLEGETLDEWLASRRPLSPDDALPLLEQMADALQVLHDAGVVHRDLKPSNVMLVPSDHGPRAVLTDFGLAKMLDDSLFETQAHVQGGAPFFMAPELFRRDRPSRASDIYAFGLVIDEMITTTRAFSADSLHGLLLQKLGDGPEPPSRRAANLPAAWERAILRCLAPDPRDRFATPTAVLAELVARPVPQPTPWRPQPWSPAPAGRQRLRRASYWVATGLVLTGAAVFSTPVRDAAPKSVVISSLKNLTGDRDIEYLAGGTAGELARRLSLRPELRVFTARDGSDPIDRARRAAYALQGHIQEVNGKLRITVQLTDNADGRLLWSQNFDGSRDRSLDLEDQLANDTVRALTTLRTASDGAMDRVASYVAGFLPRSAPRAPASGTPSNSAYDLYLRGRALFEERKLAPAVKAMELLQRAIQEDPNYAAAYATLADVHGVLMDLHYAPHSVLLPDAERYASHAVALDPNLPDAQLSLAAVRQVQWRWDDAERAYKRALELHPTSSRANRWYGGLLLQFGKFDESLALYRHSLDLDPYDYPSQSAYGHALFHAGRPLEAVAHLENLLAHKDYFYAHSNLGQAYAYLAGADPARADEYQRKALEQSAKLRETEVAAQTDGVDVTELSDLVAALAYSYRGDLPGAGPFVARLETGRAMGRVSPAILARVYAAQRNLPRAMAALLDAEAQRDREMFYLDVSPYYAGIRNEPQFRALVGRLHLSR